jgi:hypothetical protein
MSLHISFNLPATFPPEMLPDKVIQFLNDDVTGKSPPEFITLAGERGFMPTWQALPNIGPEFFGFGLCVDGLVIPLIVKISFGSVH